MPNVIEILNALRGYKPGRKQNHPVETKVLEQMTLAEFGRKNLAILVRSKVLGEDIVFISNPSCTSAYGDTYVSYLPKELEVTLKLSPSHLAMVHRIKKLVAGTIEGGEPWLN